MSSKALIIVDYQKEWTDASSDYFVGDISKAISNTNTLIDYCRNEGYRIIFVKHLESDSDDAFKEGTENSDLLDTINKKDTDSMITKYRISPFLNTTLEKVLEDIKEVVIVGILSNLCVRSTIHDAYDRDYDITVIKDCCVSFDDQTQVFTFKDIKATRPEIEFLNLNDFIKSEK